MRPLTILLALFALSTVAAPRPNVVLILADDMGFSDVGCYGGEIHTPSIDSLAKAGVRLTQFYTMARCCPSRAALLTGLYPHQAGIGAMNQDLGKPAYQGELNDRCATLAEILQGAGYRTAMMGKWHLCHLNISPGGPKAKQLVNFERQDEISPSKANWPCNRGFQEHWGTIAGVESYYDPYSLVHNEEPLKPESADFYYTDFITEHSVKALEQFAADAGNPFFMYVAYTAPHWPMQVREADVERYKETYAAGWDAVRQARFDRQVAMGMLDASWGLSPRANNPRMNDGASALGPWEKAEAKDWQARRMAVYAGMIECMDRGVGRILDTLKQRNLDRDTIVIFLSDNGGCAENVQRTWYDVPSKTRDGRAVSVGNDPKLMPGPETVYQSYGPAWANASNAPFRRFKHYTEEGGISAPFIVRWPGGQKPEGAGAIDHATVGHVIDVVPTVLAATGVAYPKQMRGHDILAGEGQSLLPAFGGTPIADSRNLFWEHEGNRAARIGDWKLLAAHNESWQLYDVAHDRTELHDLAKQKPEKVAELRQAYDAWAKRCGVEAWPVKRNAPAAK